MQETKQTSVVIENSSGINQFRLNPFRILRIPVSISLQEALWQAEKILAFARMNLSAQEPEPISWITQQTELEVKQSVQKIEEPLIRLVEQLFWFDFETDSQGTLLKEALEKGNTVKIYDYLANLEKNLNDTPNNKFDDASTDAILRSVLIKLNSANVKLLLSLSFLHDILSDESTTAKNKKKKFKVLWSDLLLESMNEWKKLLDSNEFSVYINYIIKQIGDELLDEGTVEILKKSVPARLADILSGEIKFFISQRNNEKISSLIRVAANSTFTNNSWQSAFSSLRLFFQPELAELENDLDNSTQNTELITNFYTKLEEIKTRWLMIDAKGIIGLPKLIDDAILKGFSIISSLGFTGNKLYEVQQLLDIAAEQAISDSVKERINSYKTKIVEFHQYLTCHYCGTNERHPDYPVVLNGKKETGRTYSGNTTTIHYLLKSQIVPRCEGCADIHHKIYNIGLTCTILILCILTILFMSYISDKFNEFPIGILIITGFGIWGAYYVVSFLSKRITSVFLTPAEQKPYYKISETEGYKVLDAENFNINIDLRKDALEKMKNK
jgi:hypothetical protein